MYSKKYILEEIEEFNKPNPIYKDIKGAVCYPAYFAVGERGWFLWESKDWFSNMHRIHTSVIDNLIYIGNEKIIVTTQNTRFVFKLVSE